MFFTGSTCLLVLALFLPACDPKGTDPDETGIPDDAQDQDGDGFLSHEDCDDTDPQVNPNAAEVCNGLDDDCDGQTDEEVATTWYLDADADGFGSDLLTQDACDRPAGYVPMGGDCDDSQAAAHPGAEEVCDDLDNDCDDDVDEDVRSTFYPDGDGDGYGDAGAPLSACSAPIGYLLDGTDCDDTSDAVYPGGEEVCDELDNDCDGETDEGVTTTWYVDADGDGYGTADLTAEACARPTGYAAEPTDCDDAAASTHPGAEEACNGLDDDCDGELDEGAAVPPTWYLDADRDGYGDAASTVTACVPPSGYVDDASDCDDADASVNPGRDEICDGKDDDCDGDVDEASALDASTWYRDYDEDGWGDATTSTVACTAPLGYTATTGDCDDRNDGAFPGAPETCDGEDDDCDGATDEADASDAATWYPDADGDGYGDGTAGEIACYAPTGFVADGTDCDDARGAVNPAAEERCNGTDDDCDGLVDDSSATDATTWYVDDDGDGFGDSSSVRRSCTAPIGYVPEGDDCNDASATVNPAVDELCDGTDNDCDGTVDEDGAVDASTWYRDHDGDGWGDPAATETACAAPSGFLADGGDCDDYDATVHPGAEEVCDGVDDDCDGTVDGAASVDATAWYADGDGDGWGDPSAGTMACSAPTGHTADSTDCDDGRADVNPDAEEVCDGMDDDCDGEVDEVGAADAGTWYADADADGWGNAADPVKACEMPTGYVADGTDCDDSRAVAHPGATEVCDDVDNDCDGTADEASATDAGTWYTDADGDGYGSTATVVACEAPTGTTATPGDCDDTDAARNPGAEERCNGTDDDCDGLTDDASAVDATTWYTDADGDGYGVAASPVVACAGSSGTSSVGTDCDDGDATVHPGQLDICSDGVDNDCSGADRSCGIESTENVASADAMLVGEAATDYAGYAVAFVGDADGDGRDDLLVGSYANDAGASNAGRAYLVYGPVSITMNLAGSDAIFTGESGSDYAGQDLDGAGDLDADGFADIIIGAHRDDTTTTDAGCAYIQMGPFTGSSSLSLNDAKLTGTSASDYAGFSVAAAGDVNADGRADVLVGAYLNDTGGTSAGMAYLVSGSISGNVPLSSATARFVGEDGSDYAGYAVSGAGDFDGDGIDDVLVGAYGDDQGGTSAGAVYVIHGPAAGSIDLAAADAKIYGESSSDYLGYALTSLGDPNLDGYGEILLGAYGDGAGGVAAGAAYVLSGPIGGIVDVVDTRYEVARFIGETAADYAGHSVGNAGDVNGDGANDLLVGAYANSRGGSDSGATYLMYWPVAGTLDLSLADSAILGDVASDYSGWSIDGGDADGDGYSDLLIGAYGHKFSASDDGAAYLFYGG